MRAGPVPNGRSPRASSGTQQYTLSKAQARSN